MTLLRPACIAARRITAIWSSSQWFIRTNFSVQWVHTNITNLQLLPALIFMNSLGEWASGGQTTHLFQKISFQQPEKYTSLGQDGMIIIAAVLYMFRREKVSSAAAEIHRAPVSWLPYAALISLFQKRYTGIREGREKDEAGDQEHTTSHSQRRSKETKTLLFSYSSNRDEGGTLCLRARWPQMAWRRWQGVNFIQLLQELRGTPWNKQAADLKTNTGKQLVSYCA